MPALRVSHSATRSAARSSILSITAGPEDPASEDAFVTQFSRLFQQRFPSLFRYLLHSTGDRELASDCAQEAFVRLYRRGALPDTPGAWLVTVANNLVRDHRRSSHRQLNLLSARHESGGEGEGAPAIDGQLVTEERRTQVRTALARLAPRDRKALLLRHSGYSYREIAAVLDLAESGVGTMLIRASQAFRRAYEDMHGAPD